MPETKLDRVTLALKIVAGLLLALAATFLQAQQYQSEIDNFEIQLPEVLYPVILNYDQNTAVGQVRIKNISFHSSLGKFLVEIVDYPADDARSPSSRMEAKLNQLQSNPNRQFDRVEHFVSDTAPGLMIKSSLDMRPEVHGIFVLGEREFHIRSESFEVENQQQVMDQTEAMIRSFKLIE